MNDPVLPLTRKAVWGELFELNRHRRYYRLVFKKIVRTNRLFNVLLVIAGVVFTTVSVVPFVFENKIESSIWFAILQIASCVLLVIVYYLDKMLQTSTKLEVLEYVIRGCSEIEEEMKELWRMVDSYKVGEEKANLMYLSLVKRKGTVLEMSAKISDNDKIRDRSSKEAKQELLAFIEATR